jgi:hypothetical protein
MQTPLSNRIFKDRKYYPYFKDCIGALDGTHIACHIPTLAHPRFRNRKGYLSQRSAHDQRVLSNALYQHDLEIPPGKYYLGDAGYTNSDYCMVPYRGVRYHLKEQRLANQK